MPSGSAGPVKFIAEDQLVVSAMDDHKFLTWKITLSDEESHRDMARRFEDGQPPHEHSLSQDEQRLLDASHLHLLSSTGNQFWSALAPKDVKCVVAFNHTLAATTTASGISVYRHREETVLGLVTTLSASKGSIKTLTFSQDGKHLIAGGEDNRIHIWDTDSWHEKLVLPAHDSHINSIVVSNDNRCIVSCSEDGTARVWDAEILLRGPQLHGKPSTSPQMQFLTPKVTDTRNADTT